MTEINAFREMNELFSPLVLLLQVFLAGARKKVKPSADLLGNKGSFLY